MVYYCYFKYNALVSDFFVHNKFANVFQSPTTISLLATYLKTLYKRNNKIALYAFSSSSAISLFDDVDHLIVHRHLKSLPSLVVATKLAT
jgi:dTDP-4-dehydrorhamnose reductase